MGVSEKRFNDVLTTRGRARGQGLYERNPVAMLILESMAVSHRRHDHERTIRDAGLFLLDLLRVNEPGASQLTLPVAMRVLADDEAKPAEEMHHYLLQTAQRDLLLGIALHALVGGSTSLSSRWQRRRTQREREVVIRTLYLLLRMVETQEQVDDLERQVWS